MSTGKSGAVLLHVCALSLRHNNNNGGGDEATARPSEEDLARHLRDASVNLFGNVSGLFDFSIAVDQLDDRILTIRTNKSDFNRLWSALTLYGGPSCNVIYTVTKTTEV